MELVMKSWQEEEENYKTFKNLVGKKELDVGETINKLIRRFLKENGEKVVENGE